MQIKENTKYPVVEKLKRTLIVSCQASPGEPLCSADHIRALALSAINGGARALRLEGVENIEALRKVTDLPIIGISKSKEIQESERLNKVYITASFAEAKKISEAGSDIIAIDGTSRPRADNLSLKDTIQRIHNELGKPVLADISTLEEGINAEKCQADIVSTTLYGYTVETALSPESGPGLLLLKQLVECLEVPVILEGRVWHPEEVKQAFADGAYAVVVGSAITRPQLITQRFVRSIPSH